MTNIPKRTRTVSYRSVGKTSDGVIILAPKLSPTHFKAGEIRTTIAKLRHEDADGQLGIEKRTGATDKRHKQKV